LFKEDIFALILLLSDGYLRLKETLLQDKKESNSRRFLEIAMKLPLELQMILSRRVYLSPGIFILASQTEDALKKVLSHPFF